MFDTTIMGRRYQTEPYMFNEVVSIQLEIGRMLGGVAGPGIEFASSLFVIDTDAGTVTYDPSKIKDADKGALGRAITAIPAGILSAGGPVFMRRILALTSIEDESIDGQGGKQLYRLDAEHNSGRGQWLDHIYTGGNSIELYLAIGWVLTVNLSPFGRGPFWTWKEFTAELMSVIPKLSSLSIGTTPPSGDGSTDTEQPTT